MTSKTEDKSKADPPSRTDPLLDVVAKCRANQSEAQRELVLRTQDLVHRTLVRLVGAQDAEDVSQQVYLQVFRELGSFNGDALFSTWLYKVIVNEAMQHLRKDRRRRFAFLNWEPASKAADCSIHVEERELLERALAAIDPELRAAFVLREVEGLAYEAIAHALDIPMGTVASRLSRARHELQIQLRCMGWSEGQP